MTTYEITALGGQVEYTIEADTETDAEGRALNQLKEDFRHTVGINEVQVYEVELWDGRARVAASSHAEAQHNAQQFVKGKKERALEQSRGLSQDARDIIQGVSESVTIEGPTDDTHYEISRDGRWEEGEL